MNTISVSRLRRFKNAALFVDKIVCFQKLTLAIKQRFHGFSADYREIASIIFLCRRAISGDQEKEFSLKPAVQRQKIWENKTHYAATKGILIFLALLGRFRGTEPKRCLWQIKRGRRVVQKQGLMQAATQQKAYVSNG